MSSKVDLKKLKRALSEFGTLEKAIQVLRAQKQEGEGKVAGLSATEAKLRQEVHSLEDRKATLSTVVDDLEAKIEEKRWQYEVFMGFMALVIAQEPQDIARFADSVHRWAKVKIADVIFARGKIVEQLMDKLVKSFRCSTTGCGAKFLVDRRSQRYGEKYSCPACYSRLDAEPDDSLMDLFLSPPQIQEGKEIEKLRGEVERLKPLEVFLDIPCAVCCKPMRNTWERDDVEATFKACAWAHPECWKTTRGQSLYMKVFVRELGKLKEGHA